MLEGLQSKMNRMKINENKAFIFSITNDTKDEIIRLNTEDQLFEEGIDSMGDTLGDYSDVSVEVYGKRRGHIQLYETGEFYNSFVIKVDKKGIDIIADTQKESQDLAQSFGIEILGLTTENTAYLKDFILEGYWEYVRQQILSA